MLLAFLGLNSAWSAALTLAAIYGLATIGLQLALASGQFSIMHGALLGVGAYGAAVANVLWGQDLAISLAFGAVVAAVLGAISSWVLLPLSGLFFGIASLAIGVAFSYGVQTIPGLGGAGGLFGASLDTSAGLVAVSIVIVLVIYVVVRRSTWYCAMLATGSDPIAAQAAGIRTAWYRVGAFTVGAGIAGLAGGLYIHYIGLIQPSDLGFPSETQLLVFLVIGGIATPFGGIAGALAVSALLQALMVSSLQRYWILGIALVVVVILRPRGLLQRRPLKGRREWTPVVNAPGSTSPEPQRTAEADRDVTVY